jgi:hypothetical protein
MIQYQKTLKPLLYIALFIPLFLLNIKDSHDWGDDFAQYIHQASNISKGQSQFATGYIFNPDHAFIGPPVYSVGFPLLLSPVVTLFGNNILAFNYFNTALLLIIGVLMILFLKSSLGELIAILLSLIIIYNPWTINFKCEILSDIPFTLFLLLGVLLYSRIKEKENGYLLSILVGIIISLLILIKSIGLVFLVAIALDNGNRIIALLRKNLTHEVKSIIYNSLIIGGTSFFIYFIVNNLIFCENGGTIRYFNDLYSHSGLYETILHNLRYYIENFQVFFHPKMILWDFIALIIKAFALVMFILGFTNEMLKKVSFLELLIISYILTICAFPNSTQGFRYLLPIIPFIMYYIVWGIRSIHLTRTFNTNLIAIALAFICLLTYKSELLQIIKDKNAILQGPQESEAIEVFKYIKTNTLKTDTIVFIKPRALALYTNRRSFANHPLQDSASIAAKFKQLRPHLFLLMSDIDNPALNLYIKSNFSQMKLRFKNKVFELYEQSWQQ